MVSANESIIERLEFPIWVI